MKTFYMLMFAIYALFLGVCIGHSYDKIFARPIKQRACVGYVVLDAAHVVTCSGDTIRYQWKTNLRP